MILDEVRAAAQQRILFLPHAIRQMARPHRMIRPSEIRVVAEDGELIEDYPEDARGHSCLLLGRGDDGRPIHVVCAPKSDYLEVITAYIPSAADWDSEFRMRKPQ